MSLKAEFGELVTYLIGLVIVLGIELGDLLLFGVLPLRDGLIKLGLYPPLLAVDEPGVEMVSGLLFGLGNYGAESFGRLHLLGEVDIELAGTEETELSRGVSIPVYPTIHSSSSFPCLPPESRGHMRTSVRVSRRLV